LTISHDSRVDRIRHKQRSCDVQIKEQKLRVVEGPPIQVEITVILVGEISIATLTVSQDNIKSRIGGTIVVIDTHHSVIGPVCDIEGLCDRILRDLAGTIQSLGRV